MLFCKNNNNCLTDLECSDVALGTTSVFLKKERLIYIILRESDTS